MELSDFIRHILPKYTYLNDKIIKRSELGQIDDRWQLFAGKPVEKESRFGKFLNAIAEAREACDDSKVGYYRLLANFVREELPTGSDILAKAESEILRAYPLLKHFDSYGSARIVPELIDYVDAMDIKSNFFLKTEVA